eukprot:5409420-Amphidinium_carterae.1
MLEGMCVILICEHVCSLSSPDWICGALLLMPHSNMPCSAKHPGSIDWLNCSLSNHCGRTPKHGAPHQSRGTYGLQLHVEVTAQLSGCDDPTSQVVSLKMSSFSRSESTLCQVLVW